MRNLLRRAPKKQEQPVQDVKDQASTVRRSTQDVLNKLEEIRFHCASGDISPEKMAQYQKNVESFKYKLENAPTTIFDTVVIDKKLAKLAAELKKAISDGNATTADKVCSAMAYGILKAREEVPEVDNDRLEEIMASREQRLDEWITTVNLTGRVDRLKRDIQKQKLNAEDAEKRYAKEYRVVEEMYRANPDLVKELNEFGITGKPLSGAASQLNTAQATVVDMHHQKEDLKRTLADNVAKLETIQNTLAQLDILLSKNPEKEMELPMEEIQRIQERFQDEMLKSQQQMAELSEANEKFSAVLDSIFSSSRMIDHVIKVMEKYDKIKEEEQARQEGMKQAAQLENEKRQQQMEHTEPTQIYNS